MKFLIAPDRLQIGPYHVGRYYGGRKDGEDGIVAIYKRRGSAISVVYFLIVRLPGKRLPRLRLVWLPR